MNPKLCALLALICCAPAARGQMASDPNEGSRVSYNQATQVVTFWWWGKAGATYFVKFSDDLMTWTYEPVSVPGRGAAESMNHDAPNAARLFFRVQFTTAPFSTDFDGDDIDNLSEITMGLDPLNPDSNGDGLHDGIALRLGLDPLSTDTDGDGLSNTEERLRGTNPLQADSDGDGVSDAADAFPLDAAHSQMPLPNSGDQTAPAIDLWRPFGATPLP